MENVVEDIFGDNTELTNWFSWGDVGRSKSDKISIVLLGPGNVGLARGIVCKFEVLREISWYTFKALSLHAARVNDSDMPLEWSSDTFLACDGILSSLLCPD